MSDSNGDFGKQMAIFRIVWAILAFVLLQIVGSVWWASKISTRQDDLIRRVTAVEVQLEGNLSDHTIYERLGEIKGRISVLESHLDILESKNGP